jgi:DNA-binding transcriptional LysR family regulator
MGAADGSRSLEIAAPPTFASRWLIPRLGDFQRRNPDITLNIAVRTDPFILTGSGFDAAVHLSIPHGQECACGFCLKRDWCRYATPGYLREKISPAS